MQYLFPLHLGFMICAFVLMAVAVTLVVRKGKNWLRLHKLFATFSFSSALIAFACITSLKIANNYPHFKSEHAIFGLVALSLLTVTYILGMLGIKGFVKIRKVHRVFGGVTAAMLLLPLITGILKLVK